MQIEIELDQPSLHRATESTIRLILLSEVQAIRATARYMEQDLERQTRGAASGNAWRAWKSEVYPRVDTPAKNPGATIFANGSNRTRGMLAYFSLPGVNRAKNGKYLAVPMNEAAGMLRPKRAQRGGRSGVGEITQFRLWTGIKLEPLFRPGKTPLLVARGYKTAGGAMLQKTEKQAAAMRAGGQKLTPIVVPMFALIDAQPHVNRVGIQAAGQRAKARFATLFSSRLRANRAD